MKYGPDLWVIIDKSDLGKLSSFPNRWWAIAKNKDRTFYAYSQKMISGRKDVIYIHRYILDTPSNMEVDHINHDGLDNRRCNIRNVTPSENQMNKAVYPGGRIANTGIKYISWIAASRRYSVYMCNKKFRFRKYFRDLGLAIKAVEDFARNTYLKDMERKDA